jgi:Ser/Thr protein kinase RdoA (MazF antagonist)
VHFGDLTPQQLLQALDAVGLRGDGRLLQLNSYENRVFQVMLEDGSAVVAKFYRPGRWSDAQILEEHAFALELAAAEVPVVPPLVLDGTDVATGWTLRGQPPTLAVQTAPSGAPHRFSVAARCAGREPEFDDPEVLRTIGRFLGRLHAVGRTQAFAHRHRLDPRADADRARRLLLDGGFVSDAERPAWEACSARAAETLAAAFDAAPPATLRLHGDAHRGNLLWRDGRVHVVDLDDAMQGPAVQDLWMLLPGAVADSRRELAALLDGYEQFVEFDDRELALVEPLRTLRMLRHSAWLAERWGDPTFPIHFPHFGTAAYWSQQTEQLREQLALMGR